jgi:hypothetical protein
MTSMRKSAILVLAHVAGSLAAAVAMELTPFTTAERPPNVDEYLFYIYMSLCTLTTGNSFVRTHGPRGLIWTSIALPAATYWLSGSYIVITGALRISHTPTMDILIGVPFAPIFPFIVCYGPLATAVAGLVSYLAIKFSERRSDNARQCSGSLD